VSNRSSKEISQSAKGHRRQVVVYAGRFSLTRHEHLVGGEWVWRPVKPVTKPMAPGENYLHNLRNGR
jgi:hypothetical protein